MFHSSAIIYLIAYPLYRIRIKRTYLIGVFSVLVGIFIFKTPLYQLIYYIYRGKSEVIETTNAYTMLIVMLLVYLASYILTNDSKNNSLSAYQNYLLAAIVIQIFASQSSIIMRMGYYFYIFIIFLIPEVISQQKDIKIRLIGTFSTIILLTYFYHMTTSTGYLNVVPYRFFWK